jgi:glycosyltransferase involved in cell wall biosynthesis
MKVLEASAAGVPVVVDPWAAAGLVESGREAVAIADEPEAWAETVVRLLRDDEAAARLGGRGHELWKMHYHPEVIARQIRDVVVEASASKP